MKYAFIDAEKAHYPLNRMCVWLEVSRSGFYEWRCRPTSATELARRELKIIIEYLFEDPTAPTAIAASTPSWTG